MKTSATSSSKKKLEVLFKAYFQSEALTDTAIKSVLEQAIPNLEVKSLEIYEGKNVVKAVVSSNIIDLVCSKPESTVTQAELKAKLEEGSRKLEEQARIITLFQEQMIGITKQMETLDIERTMLTKENQSLSEKAKVLTQQLNARAEINEALKSVRGKKNKESFQKCVQAMEAAVLEKQKALEEQAKEFKEKVQQTNVRNLAEKEKLEEEIEQLAQSKNVAESKLKESQGKTSELTQQISYLEDSIKLAADQKEKLEHTIAELSDSLAKANIQLKQANEANQALSKELAEAKITINDQDEIMKDIRNQIKTQSISIASTLEEEEFSAKHTEEEPHPLAKKDETEQSASEEYKKMAATIICKLKNQLAALLEENDDLSRHVKTLQKEVKETKEQNIQLKTAMCEAGGKAKGQEIVDENKELLGEVICAYKALQTHAKDLIFLYENKVERLDEMGEEREYKRRMYLEELEKYQTLVNIAKEKVKQYEQRIASY